MCKYEYAHAWVPISRASINQKGEMVFLMFLLSAFSGIKKNRNKKSLNNILQCKSIHIPKLFETQGNRTYPETHMKKKKKLTTRFICLLSLLNVKQRKVGHNSINLPSVHRLY